MCHDHPLNIIAEVEIVLSLPQVVCKAELLQLNRTQFLSLGIFVSKKVGDRKKSDHFYYISFKSCFLGGPSFFPNPTFLSIKIPREGK